MSPSVNHEISVFLYAIIVGASFSFLYDIFRITRRVFPIGRVILYLEDIIYWLATSVLSYIVLFKINDGQVRLYYFFGIVIGAIIYFLLFSSFIVGISVKAINFLIYPIKKLLHLIKKPVQKIIFKTKKQTRKTRRATKFYFYRRRLDRKMIFKRIKKI